MARSIFILAISLLTAGCLGDQMNATAYRVASPSHAARARIIEIVRSVATKTGLPPASPPPAIATKSLAYYRRPPGHDSAFDLAVQRTGEDVMVHLGAGTGPTPRDFKVAERLLDRTLLKEFGDRCAKGLW
jgi:hypothetical protein